MILARCLFVFVRAVGSPHARERASFPVFSPAAQGIRQQKLQAKALREQKEEEQRIQLDIEEARFQAEKRREAIQRARKLQYAQTERAKGLQSAVLLTEVLREREHQTDFRRERCVGCVGCMGCVGACVCGCVYVLRIG